VESLPARPKLPRRLHRVTAPTLILWGAQDRLLPARHARCWAEQLPSSQLTIIDDAGHLPLAEQPGASLEAIWAFCGES
jgi:pimeloyl-ACP methyl ester carboxylesterase